MKINFNLRFQELSRLLETRRQPSHSSPPGEFGVLLGEIDRENFPNSSGVIAPIAEEVSRGDVPARDYVAPSLHNPPLSQPLEPVEAPKQFENSKQDVGALTPTTAPSEIGQGGGNSLEVPHILSVRRITADELATLAHPERKAVVRELVTEAGRRHGVDPALSLAVASAESSFNPLAVSSDGAESKGLFQLLDTTGIELHDQLGAPRSYDPFNPALNVDLGVGYLRRLHDLFTTTTTLTNNQSTVPAANSSSLEKLAVAAFNAGEGRVAAAQQRAARAGRDPAEYLEVEPYLPESTRQYVARVIRMRDEFGGSATG